MPHTLYIASQQYSPDSGSFSSFIDGFARHAVKEGYQVVILCGTRKHGRPIHERSGAIEVIRFPLPHAPVFGMVVDAIVLARYIRRYFKHRRLVAGDLLVANGEAALGLPARGYILRAGDQPAVVMCHSMEIANSNCSFVTRVARRIHTSLQVLLEKQYVGRSAAMIYSSEINRQLFIQQYGGAPKPSFIPRSSVASHTTRRTEHRPRTILFVGSADERVRKGVMYLEQALPDVFRHSPDVRLVHVGKPFRWRVPDWCQERIISLGTLSWRDLQKQYSAADVLVSCSISEGFPNVILEAMAAGCPVITSDIIGVNEYITHMKDGVVFKRNDPLALKTAIESLFDDEKLRIRIARAGKRRVQCIDNRTYFPALLDFCVNAHLSAHNVNLLRTNR